MSTFAFLLLCIQACLVQNVFGQYLGGVGCGCGGPAVGIAPAVGIGSAYGNVLGLGAGLSPTAACGGALGFGGYGGAIGSAYGGALAPVAVYGGAGEGNVVAIGELPVAGNTAVAGQVPITGVVSFGGAVPAAGAVSVSGQCACGCDSSIYY